MSDLYLNCSACVPDKKICIFELFKTLCAHNWYCKSYTLLQAQKITDLVSKLNGPHNWFLISIAHTGTQVRNKAALLLKVGKSPLVLTPNIGT